VVKAGKEFTQYTHVGERGIPHNYLGILTRTSGYIGKRQIRGAGEQQYA
jgi:hypothetical protein